jgi:hypothetical protein
MKTGVLLGALVVALSLVSPAVSAGAEHRCGETGLFGEAGPSIVTVKSKGMLCGPARKVLEKYLAGGHPRGWRCLSAGEEGFCSRGEATVAYRSATRVKKCGSVGFEPNTDNVAGQIRVRRASCRVARRVARGSRATGPTHLDPYRAAGFSCRGRTVAGPLPLGLYTCRKGGATVVFARS